MVLPRGMILVEIASRYDRSLPTVKRWSTEDGWPDPIAKRGRWHEYDPGEVDAWVREKRLRAPSGLDPRRSYTARELETAGIGITASAIRSDLSRGRWPRPDLTEHGANLWYGSTVLDALSKRRRRNTGQPE